MSQQMTHPKGSATPPAPAGWRRGLRTPAAAKRRPASPAAPSASAAQIVAPEGSWTPLLLCSIPGCSCSCAQTEVHEYQHLLFISNQCLISEKFTAEQEDLPYPRPADMSVQEKRKTRVSYKCQNPCSLSERNTSAGCWYSW